ncbi:MAG TPA: single-stranded DNA-binding protein [Candidatus Saccharimonadales bacterium]|nr:single-stranded DNA-binding protein [Candidatus Saccharimonadales bacterium]
MPGPPVNRVQLTARVTREPELRYLPAGVPLARLALAFDRTVKGADGQPERVTNYISAVTTGPDALQAQERLRRGGEIYLEGQLQTHHWTGPDGVTRSTIEVRVEHLEILADGGAEEPDLPAPGAADGGA